MDKILEIKNLIVEIDGRCVIDNVNLDLYKKNVTALIGESGSGKTLTALAILNLLPNMADVIHGEINYKGNNVLKLDPDELREIRGKNIGMVFQEPFTALNPVIRVGVQISETISAHYTITRKELNEKVLRLLDMVKLPMTVLKSYPHELSGGMRQRVMMAIALSCDPEILILDEPTTALDVSVQKEILGLIKGIEIEKQFSVLFISHDFSVVNMVADEIFVMRNGRILESGNKNDVIHKPVHEYTKHLLDCVPRIGDERERLPEE